MKSLPLFLLLSVALAVGQTYQSNVVSPQTSLMDSSGLTFGTQHCAVNITLGGSTKRLADIFPAECGAEPEDVPAITKKKLRRKFPCGVFESCTATEDVYDDVLTCADNSRILLTAEDGQKWCHKVKKESKP